jgi:hypothetical protein
MGNCTTKQTNTGSKYYFNDFDDMTTAGVGGVAPGNINNAAMEQRVSLHITLKNVDALSEQKVELLIQLFFSNFLQFHIFLKNNNY